MRADRAKLDHAVIAAAVHQWRHHLSACVRAGGGHFTVMPETLLAPFFLDTVYIIRQKCNQIL